LRRLDGLKARRIRNRHSSIEMLLPALTKD